MIVNGIPYHKEGDFRVSYSSYKKWLECKLKYRLDVIEDLDKFDGNIHTVFGTASHEFAQGMIAGERKLDLIDWRNHLEKHFNDLVSVDHLFEEWADQGFLIQESFHEYYETDWKDWQFSSYEFLLYEFIPHEYSGGVIDDRQEIDGHPNPNYMKTPIFKGFIDLVMIDPKGNHYLIDLKTATKPWNHWKTDDDAVMAQLKLYKYFYHQKTGVPLSKIKTWYYIMPRTGSVKYRQMIEVKSTPKIIEKEMDNLNFFFELVYNSKMYPPALTQSRCRFCDYKGTKHCEQSRIML